MASVQTVQPKHPKRKRSPYRAPLARASLRILAGDVLSGFSDEVGRCRGRVQRLTIVSPWVTHPVLERLLERADRDGALVLLVTRPGVSPSHVAAISAVELAAGGRVLLNRRLHAKLYICEEAAGRGFAVIGSANMTASSKGLDELAVLIRPVSGSHLISQFAPAAARLATGTAGRRRLSQPQQRRIS